MKKEVEWFYGPLGLHEFYFSGHTTKVIADHIQSLFAAKMLSVASGNLMDVNLEQTKDDGAFFATRSNVQGSTAKNRVQTKKIGPTEVEKLERRIERNYLDNAITGYVFNIYLSIVIN